METMFLTVSGEDVLVEKPAVENRYAILFADNTECACTGVTGKTEVLAGHARDVLRVNGLETDYQTAKAGFTAGGWYIVCYEVIPAGSVLKRVQDIGDVYMTDENGEILTVTLAEDFKTGERFPYADYTLVGSITDNMDGTLTVAVGKANTRVQQIEDDNAALTAQVAEANEALDMIFSGVTE